jgi:hypothetical protein
MLLQVGILRRYVCVLWGGVRTGFWWVLLSFTIIILSEFGERP